MDYPGSASRRSQWEGGEGRRRRTDSIGMNFEGALSVGGFDLAVGGLCLDGEYRIVVNLLARQFVFLSRFGGKQESKLCIFSCPPPNYDDARSNAYEIDARVTDGDSPAEDRPKCRIDSAAIDFYDDSSTRNQSVFPLLRGSI